MSKPCAATPARRAVASLLSPGAGAARGCSAGRRRFRAGTLARSAFAASDQFLLQPLLLGLVEWGVAARWRHVMDRRESRRVRRTLGGALGQATNRGGQHVDDRGAAGRRSGQQQGREHTYAMPVARW